MNSLGYDLIGDSNVYHFPEEHHLAEEQSRCSGPTQSFFRKAGTPTTVTEKRSARRVEPKKQLRCTSVLSN